MIDSHCHLDSLDGPVDEAIERAVAAGVTGILSIATSARSADATLAIAERWPATVRVAIGVPPHAVRDTDEQEWQHILEVSTHPAVCAIGETGFDQFRDYGPIELQQALFDRHISLARERSLPVIIHSRAAEQVTLEALGAHPDLTFVMHCFSMPDHLGQLLALGAYISIAGNATYPSAAALLQASADVPDERLLIETDAPYLAPQAHRGRRNEPALLVATLEAVAAQRGQDADELSAIVAANARALFGFEAA